jgi:putative nucleotidyltransferase with HDIG domain
MANKNGHATVEKYMIIMVYFKFRNDTGRKRIQMGMTSRHHVFSGSFEVGQTQPRLLQAFLGTCVGVAVFDDTAGVGGLLHLLLPEPVSSLNVDQPGKYATTGVPIFLKRLFDLGATRKNMKAIVAGGALVGPLSPQDMHLDIGGRTAEKVYIALHSEGIGVIRSETGGFFTCCLELDMQRWECAIKPAGFDACGTNVCTAPPTLADIQRAIAEVKPIPQVALKILRLIGEDNYDIDKVAEEVKKDQVIAARTLHLCNSAMFAKRQEVLTLDHALVYLGQELFIKLVISAAVRSYYNQSSLGYSQCKGGLYHHAIGTAMIAEKIARKTAIADPAIAYTAGLLHDIGKVVLDHYIADNYPLLYREFQEKSSEIIAVETKILGMDHTRAGRLLAEKWSLPGHLTEAIGFHHRPEESLNHRSLTTIVYLADLLMSRFHSGLELERIGAESLNERLAHLDLATDQLRMLVDLIPKSVFEMDAEATQNGSEERFK